MAHRSNRGDRTIVPQSLLTLNSGSSSLKFALFEYGATGEPQVLLRGQVTPSDGELLLEALDATGNAIGDTRWQEGKDNGHDA